MNTDYLQNVTDCIKSKNSKFQPWTLVPKFRNVPEQQCQQTANRHVENIICTAGVNIITKYFDFQRPKNFRCAWQPDDSQTKRMQPQSSAHLLHDWWLNVADWRSHSTMFQRANKPNSKYKLIQHAIIAKIVWNSTLLFYHEVTILTECRYSRKCLTVIVMHPIIVFLVVQNISERFENKYTLAVIAYRTW